ncbi:unnamed protein product [Moneuplotes crassus]|uniref:Uncharacterized protein n=1 Tax=Euplotes crassus TaxID=5936 RepID=A0AAD2D2D4_EUPCR|nr:unnamed protein product [Moneuplotes crassus]
MAKVKKTTQVSLFSCFTSKKKSSIPRPVPVMCREKIDKVNRTLSRSISGCGKRKSSRNLSKSRDSDISLENQVSSVVTRSKSRGAFKKREKKAQSKSKARKSVRFLENKTIYDYTLSCKDTEVPSECTNADIFGLRKNMLTKDIQIERTSNDNFPQKQPKRKKNTKKEPVEEEKKRKTSKVSLNLSLLDGKRQLKGGITKKKTFRQVLCNQCRRQ